MADVKAGMPITPDSLFDLASVSKHMTGVAILTLVEKGTLKLDQPVAHWLEDFAVPLKGRAVTVTDLLHHVSGLADYTSDDWDGSDEEFASLTPGTHLKWLNGTKPRRVPGVKYEYNNSEYVLLALIVERLSGQSFAQYVHDHLFAPAGMEHTVILDGTAKLPSRTVKGYATNANGKVKRSSVPTVITGDGNVYGDGYGFGWVVDKDHTVSHSGSWNGTASYLLLDLQKGFTVAVLSNDENTAVGSLAEEILALFTGD